MIRVLGRFVPERLQSEIIEAQIKPLLPPCCARERVGIRIPDPRLNVHPDNLEWHQDGGGPLGTVNHMVVWASEQPTQLRQPDGTEFEGKPYELVLFDNHTVFHRQPRGTDEGRRWFVGIRCSEALPM